jgi:DNA helicase-2/ATP-dependent DNA helicase PcrA
MISLKRFYNALTSFQNQPNREQRQAIDSQADENLFVVAGPGSGKTTVLTLRVLKLILVDGVNPVEIVATTFTKKAAAELRSRILGRGFTLIETLIKDDKTTKKQKEWLQNLDINQVKTGTIDSICEQLLRDFRQPGFLPPILADEFITQTLLLNEGMFASDLYRNSDYYEFVADIRGRYQAGAISTKTSILNDIWNRRYNDQVDWESYLNDPTQSTSELSLREAIDQGLENYDQALKERGMLDFTLLEQEVLDRLRDGRLKEFTDGLSVLLVDEYQDTNLLQESIYFEMLAQSGASITVVGDDDQSLYRFRGATVELFSDFPNRYTARFHQPVQTIFLNTNYRSTCTIVDFVNEYGRLDSSYQTVRVNGKPVLIPHTGASTGLPILGMFRNDLQVLAADLASFIHDVFRGSGFTLPDGQQIIRDSDNGDLGDCALLCSSPKESKENGDFRLPGAIRDELGQMLPPIEVFNPRGEDICSHEQVALFGGIILECIDPGAEIQNTINWLSDDVRDTMNHWRDLAIDYVNDPACPAGLYQYVVAWVDRDPGKKGHYWPRSTPAIRLVWDLVHWFPYFHDDPEGQLYLEVFTRQLSSSDTIGKFKGNVVYDPVNQTLSDKSVLELLRNFLIPIASNTIKIDEELVQIFPRDRLSILSVHQAKGLEFPLTIVDVGSDFRTNASGHAFKRFPRSGGLTHNMEDYLRAYSPITIARSGIDRAFDDLYRQYFVAFSRPQTVLLLVGHSACMPGGGVLSVSTGRDRQGQEHWDAHTLVLI